MHYLVMYYCNYIILIYYMIYGQYIYDIILVLLYVIYTIFINSYYLYTTYTYIILLIHYIIIKYISINLTALLYHINTIIAYHICSTYVVPPCQHIIEIFYQ